MLAKRELLFNKHISSPSITHSFDGLLEDLELIMNVLLPFLFQSMLANILTISRETRISLSGKLLLFISSIKSTKCDISFEISYKFDVKGVQMLSKNLDQFSVAVLRPMVNDITSISGL